jgi:hypothetical protein
MYFFTPSLAILLAIPREFFTLRLLAAMIKLPFIFFRMVLLLFKLRGVNNKFIHSPRGVPK